MNDLRKAAQALIEHWEAGEFKNCTGYMAGHIRILREALTEPEQYDQTALELCEKCGWKAIMPDEGCLVCAREELR